MKEFYHALDNEMADIHPDFPIGWSYRLHNELRKTHKSYHYKLRRNINLEVLLDKPDFNHKNNVPQNSNKPLYLISNSGSGWY